jgi:hypothetical protein
MFTTYRKGSSPYDNSSSFTNIHSLISQLECFIYDIYLFCIFQFEFQTTEKNEPTKMAVMPLFVKIVLNFASFKVKNLNHALENAYIHD